VTFKDIAQEDINIHFNNDEFDIEVTLNQNSVTSIHRALFSTMETKQEQVIEFLQIRAIEVVSFDVEKDFFMIDGVKYSIKDATKTDDNLLWNIILGGGGTDWRNALQVRRS